MGRWRDGRPKASISPRSRDGLDLASRSAAAAKGGAAVVPVQRAVASWRRSTQADAEGGRAAKLSSGTSEEENEVSCDKREDEVEVSSSRRRRDRRNRPPKPPPAAAWGIPTYFGRDRACCQSPPSSSLSSSIDPYPPLVPAANGQPSMLESRPGVRTWTKTGGRPARAAARDRHSAVGPSRRTSKAGRSTAGARAVH